MSEIKIGDKFSRLTVVGFFGFDKHKNKLWDCECECGNHKVTTTSALKAGAVKSCGCMWEENKKLLKTRVIKKHGMVDTHEYHAWNGMRQRCYNKNSPKYKNYGARGIRVCERWLHSFENFYADMGKSPEGFSLDRIDVNGNYCPENCRWADDVTQCNNRQFNFKITFNGKTETLRYWSEITGITKSALYLRIHRRGWSAEKALTNRVL